MLGANGRPRCIAKRGAFAWNERARPPITHIKLRLTAINLHQVTLFWLLLVASRFLDLVRQWSEYFDCYGSLDAIRQVAADAGAARSGLR